MKKIYITAFLLCLTFITFAQTKESPLDSIKRVLKELAKLKEPDAVQPDAFVPNLIPPSPTAASLGKHTDFPVNIYNGIPSVPIPIYQLKSRNITVPIALNYHASGIKVGEIASWCGLGWSLDAGGLITRSVRGLPDEESSKGFFATRLHYPNPDNISFAGVDASIWKTDVVEAAKGNTDFEQDIYMLNAMGRSYKLLFKSDGTILTIPKSDLKISVDFPTDTWEITIEDGTKLAFGGSNYTEITTGDATLDVDPFGSTWYLKSITSHQGDVVNFTYTYSLIEQDITFAQSDFIKTQEIAGPGFPPIINSNGTRTILKTRNVAILQLSSISSELGTVTFTKESTERQDLTGSYALSKISATPTGSTFPIEEYQLTYNYSDAVSSGDFNPTNQIEFSKRLKLSKIERKTGTDLSQPWIFTYNSNSLPSRRSFAQDAWGYFNRAIINTTFLPNYHLSIPTSITGISTTDYGFFPPLHTLGANRDADSLAMQAEMLTSVQYPTGGKTVFSFEANIGNPAVIESYETNNLNVSLTPTNTENFLVSFPITKEQYLGINADGNFDASILNDIGSNNTVAMLKLFVNDDDTSPTLVWSASIKKNQLSASGSFNFNKYINIQNIPGGQSYYTFVLSTPLESQNATDFSINGSIEYQYLNITGKPNYVGGVRLRKMLNDNGLGSKTSEHFYHYEDPFVINPIYLTDYLETTSEAGYYAFETYQVNTRNSNSKSSLGSIQGGTVGYGKITTFTDSLATNGKTVSIFTNVADEGTAESKFFPYPSTNPREQRRGLLSIQTDFRADNTKVKEIENFYDFPFATSITGVKAGFLQVNSTCSDPYGYCGIAYSINILSTERVNKIKTIERNYDPTGTYAVETMMENFYENPIYTQITRSISTEGKSDKVTIGSEVKDRRTIETAFKYPYDFTTAPYSNMVTKNIIAPVIEKTAKLRVLDDAGTPTYTTLSEEKTTFGTFSPNLYLPQKIETRLYGGLGIWVTPVEFLNYDSRGNLIKYRQRNGQTTNLTYYATSDYGKTDLVKSISVGGGTAGTELSRSMNYDYLPLIGLSLSSDVNAYLTKYAYDDFNRLKSVKDHNDFLLKDFRYHYYNETNPAGIGVSASSDLNFVVSRMAREAQTGLDLSSNVDLSSTQLQYTDGLGRDLQTLLWQATPDKSKDILSGTTQYDAFGRAYKGILPTPSDAALGMYKPNAQSLASVFYDGDTYPYSETIFEPSPLNRPQKIFGVGQNWRVAGNEKFTEISYRVAGTEVIQFDIQADDSVKYENLYQPSSLYNQVTTSERGFLTIELKDRQGKVTHKFQQTDIGNIFAITAYIYDDLGRLKMVVPPEMYKKITELRADVLQVNKSFTEADEIFKEGMYGYHYDGLGRQIEKHIPGAGWRYSVFNKNDYEVAFADDSDKSKGYWQFRKYDALGRIIQTGILNGKGSTSRTTLQNAFDEHSGLTYETTGTDLLGYTNISFPTGYIPSEVDIMTVTHYDDYAWQTETAYNFNASTAFHTQGLTKGLVTGMLSRNIETNDWLKIVNYYDYKGRLIQSFFKNHKGNIERSETQYRFNGEVLIMRMEHEGINEIYNYETDHVGRKKSFKHTLNGTLKNVAKYEFDEIGRLKVKKLSPTNDIGTQSSGDWNNTNVWLNGSVPSVNDHVFINEGHSITIPNGQAGSAGSLFLGGILNNYGRLDLGKLPSTFGESNLQSIDYSYHIRGGLRGINLDLNNNNASLSGGKLFSLKLGYEEDNIHFDGIISSQFWLNALDNLGRSYTYTYDGASRIKTGNFTGGKSNENYSLENINYDANGNILTLNRKGKTGVNAWGYIDQLNYVYENNSNKIKKVSDLQGLSNQNVGDFRDSSNVTTEYEYWQDGSLKIDRNKKISNIDYNYLKLPRQINFEGGQWIKNQYDAIGKKIKSTTSDGIIYDFVGNIIYKNNVLYQISHDEGRVVNGNYEFDIKDHLGNLRLSFRDSSGIAKIVTKLDYDPWGLTLKGLDYSNLTFNKNNFQYNSKEKSETFGLNWIDFGSRQYMPDVPHFTTIDPFSEKTMSISTFTYTNNNPINMTDRDGKFAVSVHYTITYEVLRSLGYSKKKADLIAHYSSTYADHPPEMARFGDFMFHPLEFDPHVYRQGIDYTKTSESQLEKNSHWHSMMSDEEAKKGMTNEQAMKRGLKFGWDNIFASNGGKDMGKLGQGLHALQDAIAHRGMQTNDHLGANWSSLSQTIGTDMYGSTTEARNLTYSATIVLELLQGKKANLRDGDDLTLTGMSGSQVKQILELLLKQGFHGTIKTN